MRVFTGGIATETNTFSPMPTGMADYQITRPEHLTDGSPAGAYGSPFNLWRERSEGRGWEFTFSFFAFAQPAGLTVRSVYERLRDELLAALREAMPVDVVLLFLHGAMVAKGYDDCEADLVARIRRIVGPKARIGVELDLHCTVNRPLLEAADAIILYKEYPHTDINERAGELFEIIAAAAEGSVEPVMATFDCRMIGKYLTTTEPMMSFVQEMVAAEQEEGVLSLSLAHCFPWCDRPYNTAQILAIADGDPARAEEMAGRMGRRFLSLRHRLDSPSLTLDEALDRALSAREGPVVVADQSDNAGGGAPGDSTFALRALLEREAQDVALAMIWDPVAVQFAIAAGEGATLELRLGGKVGPMSGDPLDLTCTVTGIAPDLVQEWPQQSGPALNIPCGDAVALRVGQVDVVVNSRRCQVFSPQVFSKLGIAPRQRRVLVVKSTQHFYAAFAPIASQILYMAAPGAVAPLVKEIPYRQVDTSRLYPWVDDPFEE